MNKWTMTFLSCLFCVVPTFGDSFLTAQSFPKIFEDLSFTEKIEVLEDGYQPFADLSAYDILNIVYTDESIADEIAADETSASNQQSDIPAQTAISSTASPMNATGYCKQIAPHIQTHQKIPFGKPVLQSDYKYCSGYGVRNFGTKDKPKNDNHYGFDIGCTLANYDNPVFTPADGVVERVKVNCKGSSAGNYILINHQNGFKTYYMHLNTILVTQGQQVSAGCQIGTIGYTGGAKAFKKQFANDDYPVMRKSISHLHYEMHYSGSAQSVTGPNGNLVPIVHKFSKSKSIDPAYFMGIK